MKPKKCKVCNKEFEPKKYASCKTKCEQCIKDFDKAKRFEYLKKQFEKPLKPQKPLKQKPDAKWNTVAKLVKERDAKKPCICCGETMQPHEIDAGHFIPRSKLNRNLENGLYYDLDNLHAQCKKCNRFRTDKSQVHNEFLRGLIKRYGVECIEILKTKAKEQGVIFNFEEKCLRT